MSPRERLANILWESRLRGFQTYGGGDPAICFTESTPAGLGFLINQRGYAPWGLVFDRQTVYDAGGGPVWHVRPEQRAELGNVTPRVRAFLVHFEAGRSEWLEEREWRLPLSPTLTDEPSVALQICKPVAVLVADPSWMPAKDDWVIARATGQYELGLAIPGLFAGLPRWWWNAEAQALQHLAPVG